MRFLVTVATVTTLGFIAAVPATAGITAQTPPAVQPAASHARSIARACPSQWESAPCLKAVSQSNRDLVLKYAEALESGGKHDSLEPLKQNCAAATVSDQPDIPAYAYKSAYTECANAIYDLEEKTGLRPDLSHYQLLVGAVLCLSGDTRCAALESQMQQIRN